MDAEEKAAKKEQQRREKIIFAIACERLGLQPVDAAQRFGVTRMTYWNWRHGESKIPKDAFVRLVEIENGVSPEVWERMQSLKAVAERVKGGASQP